MTGFNYNNYSTYGANANTGGMVSRHGFKPLQYSSDYNSVFNPENNTLSTFRKDATGRALSQFSWRGESVKQNFAMGTTPHNPFLIYHDGRPVTDLHRNLQYKTYDEWMLGSRNVIKDPCSGLAVLDPNTQQVMTRCWFNMSTEKWIAIVFRMVGCKQLAERAVLTTGATYTPVVQAATQQVAKKGFWSQFKALLHLSSNPGKLAASISQEAILANANSVHYETRMRAAFKGNIMEMLWPKVARQGAIWKWPFQRVKGCYQNFIYNNAMGRSFIEKSFAGMIVPVLATVGVMNAFLNSYDQESRNGSSSLLAFASGIAGAGEELVKTVVSYKMADLAFYAAKLGLMRIGAGALLGGPVGIIVASCLPMAIASVAGNHMITGLANRVKYAFKMGNPT